METNPTTNISEPISILIVDDEGTYRQVMAMRLRATGRFVVTECDGGAEAIDLLSSQSFDVVVLDHFMPEVSGLNVLQRIHEQKWDFATVMLTGAGSENIATEAMKLGAYDYIVKHQIDFDHLPVILQGVHERHLFRKEKEQRRRDDRDRATNAASVERLRAAVHSFEHVANTTLSVMSLALDECEHDLIPSLGDERGKLLDRTIKHMRQDHQLLSLVVRSLMDITVAMTGKITESPHAKESHHDLERQLKSIQERFADESSKEDR